MSNVKYESLGDMIKNRERTNALAELAHWLECDTRTLETASLAQLNRIRKAQRIVAELAKLQFDANGKPNMYDAFYCAIDCREIAEEGANDGK